MQIAEITNTNAENFAPLIDGRVFPLLSVDNVFARGVTVGGTPAAALIAIEEDGVLHFKNLFVAPNYRRRGYGSALVGAASDYAVSRRLKELRAKYCLARTEAAVADMFYMRSGFMPPMTEETVFTVSLDTLKNSYLYAHRVSLDEYAENGQFFPFFGMPEKVEAMFNRQSGKEIPTFISASNVRGTPLPDLSLVYVFEEKIEAFAAFTELEGEIYLNFAYSATESIGALLAILSEAYRKFTGGSKYRNYKTLKIVAVSGPSLKIITKLCEGSDTRTETVRETFYRYPQTNSFLRTAGNAICIPKLNGIAPFLNEKLSPTAVKLVMPNEGAPYLTFSVEAAAKSVEIQLRYEVLEPENQDAFVLCARAEIAFPDADVSVLEETVSGFNENSLAAFAVRGSAENTLIVKAGLPEGAVFDDESIWVFVRLFVRGIRDIAFHLSS